MVTFLVFAIGCTVGFTGRSVNRLEKKTYAGDSRSEVQLRFPGGVGRFWRSGIVSSLERFPNLVTALNTAFIRRATFSSISTSSSSCMDASCVEDFFEVGLCCGNGYGSAALKLVRSLYERAVTLRYLHEHPEELREFWDYHHVAWYKLMVPVDETLGKKTISDEMRAKLTAEYERVKDRFMVTACEKCGTKRLNHTWSKLDFVSMSKKTRGVIGRLILPGYFLPLRHAHATVGALLSRVEHSEVEGLSFSPTAQRKEADEALMTAQNIIVDVLNVQDERFKIPGLAEQIQRVIDDFGDMYGKPKTEESK